MLNCVVLHGDLKGRLKGLVKSVKCGCIEFLDHHCAFKTSLDVI